MITHPGMPLIGHQKVGNYILPPSLPTVHILLILLVPRKPILAQRKQTQNKYLITFI